MLRAVRGLLMLVALLLTPAAQSADQSSRQVLRAALFEYIPGYEDDQLGTLRQEIETRFERMYPQVDLLLTSPSNRDGLYSSEALKKWLGEEGDEHFHVMEIDTQLLGDLVLAGVITPFSPAGTDNLFDVGMRAVTFEGQVYGVPHLLCGHFLFARDPSLLEGQGQSGLLQKLASDGDDGVDLVGDFEGSWTLPSLYLDAWMDRNPGGAQRKHSKMR